ncbi:MAG: discoidin domain-containing protein [Planctomycetota bacterium]
MFRTLFVTLFSFFALAGMVEPSVSQVLDKRELLERQTFWDNRDFPWYIENIPFFECPEPEIETTYYYRWELLTKHLTYGSPDSGYLFTEFIDRPFWSGAFGAISCPAGHQLYEARWLKNPAIAQDYARYWLNTPGAQPRNYSTWLADSVLSVDAVHPDSRFCLALLDGLIENFEQWKNRHYDPSVGLFWQTGHDDGMEFNIASRQTQDILRGAPSYRPSFNAYMWADARAIAELARRDGRLDVAKKYDGFAEQLRLTMFDKLWDPKRKFFFPMFRNNEQRDGYEIPAGTLVYQAGQFAGDSHGRELIGYVPWQFRMLEGSTVFDEAWTNLMRRDGFYAEFGPCTVERNDPMFLIQKSCCWWSGQSWPYATTQTLKGLANRLQTGGISIITPQDYQELLRIYARSHRKEGLPYLAEALHPDTGSFEGHDGYNHSEHYFHSGFCDLVITGLVGIVPSWDDRLTVHSLAPRDWEYFALDGIRYRDRDLTVLWDRTGNRYQKGKGLVVLVDGVVVARQETLEPVTFTLPLAQALPFHQQEASTDFSESVRVNHAVNNEGHYFPRLTTTSSQTGTSIAKLQDGNYWYLAHPPNRWENARSDGSAEVVELDFGSARHLSELKLYFLDDASDKEGSVASPQSVTIALGTDGGWKEYRRLGPDSIFAHAATAVAVSEEPITKLRLQIEPQPQRRVGMTEIEAWGQSTRPYPFAAPPDGNLAFRAEGSDHPRAIASHSDRFGGAPEKAIDGKTVFTPTPMNRWTSYESSSEQDWLEIQFGKQVAFNRVELAIYDDRGGVQPPESYHIEWWDGTNWYSTKDETHTPERPAGSQWNVARFSTVESVGLRIVFKHRLPAKSGVTEVMVWKD